MPQRDHAPSNLEIALLKTYPFDSAVQRMTVVSKKKGAAHFDMYVKGAPEKVAGLCKPETSELLSLSSKNKLHNFMNVFSHDFGPHRSVNQLYNIQKIA